MTARVFYSLSDLPDWIDVAREMQRTLGWEPCYWLTVPGLDELVAEAFPETTRHMYYRASRSLPPESSEPIHGRALDEPTLERFRTCESRVLAMMDRYDPDGSFTYPDRIRHYHRLLSYWLGVADAVRPEVAVFAATPHEVADYVAYHAFHLSGIPTLIFSEANLPELVWVRDGIDTDLLGLSERYSFTLEGVSRGDNDQRGDLLAIVDRAADVPDLTKDYLHGLLGSYEDALPDYMREQLVAPSRIRHFTRRAMNAMKVWRWGLYARNRWGTHAHGWDLLKKRGVPMEESWLTTGELQQLHRAGKRKKVALGRAYARGASEVDLNEAYVYVPLHYQPERTTSAEGGDYTHQLLMVALLHDLLPEGWYVYVREHPSQFVPSMLGQLGRQEVFYADLLQYPRVRLVDHDVSPFALIDSARAVATVTGTAGWEAVVRGVPTLVFGNAWYRLCEGVFPIKSAGDLHKAYAKISGGMKVDPAKVACFIRAAHAVGSKADSGQHEPCRFGDITLEENVAGLTKLLRAAITDLDSR